MKHNFYACNTPKYNANMPGVKTPKNHFSGIQAKQNDNIEKKLTIKIQKLIIKKKRLAADPATDPAELEQIEKEIQSLKAVRKRHKLLNISGNDTPDAVNK